MDMVERVARAIEAAMDAGSPTGWAGEFDISDLARAAIAAMREPTEEMIAAGADMFGASSANHYEERYSAVRIWLSMFDAALSPRTSQQAPSSE